MNITLEFFRKTGDVASLKITLYSLTTQVDSLVFEKGHISTFIYLPSSLDSPFCVRRLT